MKKLKNTLLVLVILVLNIFTAVAQNAPIKPNIVIFYADDLGWQDTQLNAFGDPTPWETPNILKLANEGINFTNAYSGAPTCAPSRGALVTGLHPTKTGLTHVAGGKIPEGSKHATVIAPFIPIGIMPEHTTIAEILKANGYKTGHSGKWHLGNLEVQNPTNQGFDFSFDTRGAHQGPRDLTRITAFATDKPNDPYRLSEEKYPPFSIKHPEGISYPKDDVTDQAIAFMDQNKNEPFFLYLAHWLVHAPIHTKNKELLQYYCDKLGIEFPTVDKPIKTPGQTNPYYGAMVTTLDLEFR